MAAIDPAALGKAVETLLRKRQNNRKATSGASRFIFPLSGNSVKPLTTLIGDEFNISTDDQKHIISTVRLGASSNPVFYTGLPASDPTKPAKLGPNPLEDRRLSLSDTKAITDGLNEFIVRAPLVLFCPSILTRIFRIFPSHTRLVSTASSLARSALRLPLVPSATTAQAPPCTGAHITGMQRRSSSSSDASASGRVCLQNVSLPDYCPFLSGY